MCGIAWLLGHSLPFYSSTQEEQHSMHTRAKKASFCCFSASCGGSFVLESVVSNLISTPFYYFFCFPSISLSLFLSPSYCHTHTYPHHPAHTLSHFTAALSFPSGLSVCAVTLPNPRRLLRLCVFQLGLGHRSYLPFCLPLSLPCFLPLSEIFTLFFNDRSDISSRASIALYS